MVAIGVTTDIGRPWRWMPRSRMTHIDHPARGGGYAPPLHSGFLELFADELMIDRVGTAAAHGDREQHDADQENIFVAAGPGRISLRQMGNYKRDTHFDRECRGEEARE